jgi:hypothetical protein
MIIKEDRPCLARKSLQPSSLPWQKQSEFTEPPGQTDRRKTKRKEREVVGFCLF